MLYTEPQEGNTGVNFVSEQYETFWLTIFFFFNFQKTFFNLKNTFVITVNIVSKYYLYALAYHILFYLWLLQWALTFYFNVYLKKG